MEGEETFCIEIPRSLYNRMKRICDEVDCDNINDFVIKMLREKISELEEELYAVGVTDKERREIIERLKKLGYL